MIFTDKSLLDSLFKSSTQGAPVGRVQALTLGRECVPFILGDNRFLMEFHQPFTSVDESFFSEKLYRDVDGDYFIPMLNHTRFSIWIINFIDEELAFIDSADGYPGLGALVSEALHSHASSHPEIKQYFFEANREFGAYLIESIEQYDSRPGCAPHMKMIKEVEPPSYGLAIC